MEVSIGPKGGPIIRRRPGNLSPQKGLIFRRIAGPRPAAVATFFRRCAAHLDASSMLTPLWESMSGANASAIARSNQEIAGANASAIARSDKETTYRKRSKREHDRTKQLI